MFTTNVADTGSSGAGQNGAHVATVAGGTGGYLEAEGGVITNNGDG